MFYDATELPQVFDGIHQERLVEDINDIQK
jgi:hypothetical protein